MKADAAVGIFGEDDLLRVDAWALTRFFDALENPRCHAARKAR